MARSDNPGISRRNFLAVAGATGGALVVGQANLLGAEAPATQKANFAMLPFGSTGQKVSLVSFGAIRLQDPAMGARLLKMGVEAGMNLIHTARGYTGGNSVKAIGRLFEQNPQMRKQVILCVKEGARPSEKDLDADLAKMNTDYADVYLPQLQQPNQSMMEDAIADLQKLKQKGKIRFGGFTTHSNMNEVIELVLAKAPKGYDCTLMATNMLRPGNKTTQADSDRFKANLRKLRDAGVGVISMKSGASDVVGKGPEAYGAHMRVLAAAGVDTCITSFASFQTIENAVKADLTRVEATAADYNLWRQHWLASGWPCLMCGRCEGVCPAGLPVASLMRFVMYRDHYHMDRHARQEFASLGLDPANALQACGDCTSCSQVCPVGLASSGKVQDIVGSLA